MTDFQDFIKDPKHLLHGALGELFKQASDLQSFNKAMVKHKIELDEHEKRYIMQIADFYMNQSEILKTFVSES